MSIDKKTIEMKLDEISTESALLKEMVQHLQCLLEDNDDDDMCMDGIREIAKRTLDLLRTLKYLNEIARYE